MDSTFEHISVARLGEELDHWRFVWVLLAELEGQLEGAILKTDIEIKSGGGQWSGRHS